MDFDSMILSVILSFFLQNKQYNFIFWISAAHWNDITFKKCCVEWIPNVKPDNKFCMQSIFYYSYMKPTPVVD